MSDGATTRELIERLVRQSGIRKNLAAEILHAIPEVIEEGLNRDGEVRVKGLGTFRMKWTKGRIGRNPKTGGNIEIPSHYRLVFLPEQSLKEFINRDNRLLSYKVIPGAPRESDKESEDRSQKSEDRSQKTEDRSQKTEVRSEPVVFAEPEPYARKRRVHWIVPAAVIVIAVLTVVFYFRNFYHVEKKSEDRSQKTEEIVQSSKIKVQSGDSVKAEPEPQQLITQNSITPTQNSKLKTQNSKLKTQNSEGKHLFQLAREEYGNPFLWVLIYKANTDKIPDPDVVIAGKELVIPELEGKPRQLSHNDSLNIADGYRLVYEFYLDKGNPEAEDFHQAFLNYLPK